MPSPAGFTTTVLPAAKAAPTLAVKTDRGEFQGMTMPITPIGSRRI